MFDSFQTTEKGFSAPLFVTQLILAPLGGFIFGGVATILLESMLGMRNNSVLAYLAYSLQGLLLGFKMQTTFPRALDSGGRWVWVVPLCNAVFWMIDESGRGAGSRLSYYFVFQNRPGLAGIEMFVATLPALASCMYTLGAVLASQPPERNWLRNLHKILRHDDSPKTTSES